MVFAAEKQAFDLPVQTIFIELKYDMLHMIYSMLIVLD